MRFPVEVPRATVKIQDKILHPATLCRGAYRMNAGAGWNGEVLLVAATKVRNIEPYFAANALLMAICFGMLLARSPDIRLTQLPSAVLALLVIATIYSGTNKIG